jgi:small subunit ribosomal protein S9
MAEEERQDEQQEQQEETPAEESAESSEEQAPEAEAPAPEQEAPAEEEAPVEEEVPAAETKEEKEAVPGAELEPIAIEEERELSAEERARREAEAEERARREAEATEETGEEPAPTREPAVALEGDVRVKATGKRKSSVARVIVLPGSGRFEVNRRELDEYFPRPFHQTMARQPLVTTGYEGNVDVRVRVHGGGVSGQAGAVRHGVARALCEIDPELRGDLKRRGLLTRDARRKERRKAGLKKARKRPQFSKR